MRVVVGVIPVPLREGGEDSSGERRFEAAVAAGGIRVCFFDGIDGGEPSGVSSRMRNRLTARRDWDMDIWGSGSSNDLQSTVRQ